MTLEQIATNWIKLERSSIVLRLSEVQLHAPAVVWADIHLSPPQLGLHLSRGSVQMISSHMMLVRGCKTTVLLYHFPSLLVPSHSGSVSILVVQFGLHSCAINLQCSVYPYTFLSSFPRRMNFTTDLIRIHPIKIEPVCVLIWFFVLGWDVFLWLGSFFVDDAPIPVCQESNQISCSTVAFVHRVWWLHCNVYPAHGVCIWKAGRTY